MVSNDTSIWGSLEAWRATAFTVAGVVFVADAVILAGNLALGTEQYTTFGQGLIGTAWTAGFVGLLGFYPSLARRGRWLSRGGGVFAVIGLSTVAIMALVSFGLFVGAIGGALSDYTMYFLPGVFLGIVFGFGSYGVASLRASSHAPRVGLLFLLLVATFLFNLGSGVAGFNPLAKVFGVVAVLSLAMLVLGYSLRTDSEETALGGTPARE